MAELPEPVLRTLREIVAPLVEADGGVLYVLSRDSGLALHLAGACGGCPGIRTTTTEVIEPAVRASGFRGELTVTSGWIVPEGAERVAADVAGNGARPGAM